LLIASGILCRTEGGWFLLKVEVKWNSVWLDAWWECISFQFHGDIKEIPRQSIETSSLFFSENFTNFFVVVISTCLGVALWGAYLLGLLIVLTNMQASICPGTSSIF
jgi:hypothetical protein